MKLSDLQRVEMIGDNYLALKQAMAEATLASGREPEEVTLIAVSKTHPPEQLLEAYHQGCRDFGENRVQEALPKLTSLPEDIRWHLIGTLQLNKVRKAVGNFSLIHSVDSYKLAEKISEVSLEREEITPILLQVNTSKEPSKHGFSESEAADAYAQIAKLQGVRVEGLMTIGPYTEDENEIRSCFSRLRKLRDTLGLHHLSMGMTHDWQIAIQEGATLLRVGSAIFGAR